MKDDLIEDCRKRATRQGLELTAVVAGLLMLGFSVGHLTGLMVTPQCPEPIADRWATSESTHDAGALITSPEQPPPDAGPAPWPATVQLDSLDSVAGEWTSVTGEPSPEAVIRIVSDDPDEPRWKLRAWGEAQWFVGCDVYRSLRAYCKLYDAQHRDVPLSLRGVLISVAMRGETMTLGVDDDVVTLRRGSVASGRKGE